MVLLLGAEPFPDRHCTLIGAWGALYVLMEFTSDLSGSRLRWDGTLPFRQTARPIWRPRLVHWNKSDMVEGRLMRLRRTGARSD